MDWTIILSQIFEIVLFPLLSIGTTYLIVLINAKIKEIKQKTNDEKLNKYLDMLNCTITQSVIATTQTYVESLKKQGKFDAEAQKAAFEMTYENVMRLLAADAKEFLEVALGDLEAYVNSKIEAEVALNK